MIHLFLFFFRCNCYFNTFLALVTKFLFSIRIFLGPGQVWILSRHSHRHQNLHRLKASLNAIKSSIYLVKVQSHKLQKSGDFSQTLSEEKGKRPCHHQIVSSPSLNMHLLFVWRSNAWYVHFSWEYQYAVTCQNAILLKYLGTSAWCLSTC